VTGHWGPPVPVDFVGVPSHSVLDAGAQALVVIEIKNWSGSLLIDPKGCWVQVASQFARQHMPTWCTVPDARTVRRNGGTSEEVLIMARCWRIFMRRRTTCTRGSRNEERCHWRSAQRRGCSVCWLCIGAAGWAYTAQPTLISLTPLDLVRDTPRLGASPAVLRQLQLGS
jgi:hypothetical protein